MTMWFNIKPGQFVVSTSDEDQPPFDERLDEHALLIGADCPDWARIPPETPHPDAGERFRVKEIVAKPCPKCEVACDHWLLEGSELRVAACTNGCSFLVYTLPKESEDDD